MQKMMTKEELEDLVACYIHAEGYTDLRSIYDVMRQEYPGEIDSKLALEVIRKVLKVERA
ncbi:MAG: hypothetical protein IJG35_03370 [Bacteroidales bacterium]|nr:hypothetical protein [Bacteroidales bacterium]